MNIPRNHRIFFILLIVYKAVLHISYFVYMQFCLLSIVQVQNIDIKLSYEHFDIMTFLIS